MERLGRSQQVTPVQCRGQGPCWPLPGPKLQPTRARGPAAALGPSSALATPQGAPARGPRSRQRSPPCPGRAAPGPRPKDGGGGRASLSAHPPCPTLSRTHRPASLSYRDRAPHRHLATRLVLLAPASSAAAASRPAAARHLPSASPASSARAPRQRARALCQGARAGAPRLKGRGRQRACALAVGRGARHFREPARPAHQSRGGTRRAARMRRGPGGCPECGGRRGGTEGPSEPPGRDLHPDSPRTPGPTGSSLPKGHCWRPER